MQISLVLSLCPLHSQDLGCILGNRSSKHTAVNVLDVTCTLRKKCEELLKEYNSQSTGNYFPMGLARRGGGVVGWGTAG